MTIKNLALAAVALCALSCTDYENGFDLTEYKYEQAFVDRFGEIDPNQNWGFGEMPVATRSITTRANGNSAGEVDVQTNNWAARKTENGKTVYIDDALINHVAIPGWPNFDGKYYSGNGGDELLPENILDAEPEVGSTLRPIGDVTDHEVLFVTNYFRTHQYKESMQKELIKLHLTDFFIQNVSQDADQDNYPIGNNLTTSKIANTSGEHENDVFGMNYLVFKPEGASNVIDDSWTHINDYNRQKSNWSPEDVNNISTFSIDDVTPKINVRNIKYVSSSGTEDFAYKSSFSEGEFDIYRNDYVLVKLTWTEKGKQREGYYLAFDYSAEKESGAKTPCDGYYSNWILKITPAYPNTNTPDDDTDIPVPPVNRRIMCEDLGNTYDFDFNDVVFDVKYETKNDKTEAVVTLQAAGGTLPVYIGVEGNGGSVQTKEYEIHERFGVATNVPVNVGTQLNGGKSCPVSIIRFDVSHLTSGKTDPNNIFIRVEGHGLASKEPVVLTGEAGKIPQKICVPTTVGWTKELEDIQDAYPFFNKWVSDATNWTCVLSTADEQEGWTGKISANWYNLNYDYTNWNNAHKTGTAPVKKIKISKNSSSYIYYIWHSYRNTNYLYKYDFLPKPTQEQIKDSNEPDDFGEGSQEDPNAKYNIFVQSENTDFGTASIINGDGTTSDQKSNCDKGSQYTIRAVAKDGYIFDKWDDGDTHAERTITVNSEHTYIAHFAFNTEGYTKIGELDGDNINLIGNPTIEQGAEYIVVANISAVGSESNPAVLKINSSEWRLGWDTTYEGMAILKVYGDTELNPSFSFTKENNITVSKLAIYKKNN